MKKKFEAEYPDTLRNEMKMFISAIVEQTLFTEDGSLSEVGYNSSATLDITLYDKNGDEIKLNK